MKINIDTTVALKDEELKILSKKKFNDKDIRINRTPIKKRIRRRQSR